jgi:dsRNA-specific ribonuclease
MDNISKFNNFYQQLFKSSPPQPMIKSFENGKFTAYCKLEDVNFKGEISKSKKEAKNSLYGHCLKYFRQTPGILEQMSILEILEKYWCNKEKYKNLLKILGIENEINNKTLKFLLLEACTHPSALKYSTISTPSFIKNDYNNLEFVGDRVLNLIVSEYYVKKYRSEKIDTIQELYTLKTQNDYIKKIIYELGIDKYLIHECNTDINLSNKIFADQGEALIGALNLGLGLNVAKKFIFKYFKLDDITGSKFDKYRKIIKKL